MKYRIKLNHGYYAILDKKDYIKLKKYTWFIRNNKNTIYVERWGKKEQPHIHMHREIMNPKYNEQVDHINGNGLDNRRCNLRICSQSQNQANSKIRKDNTSGYKGITFHKATNKWQAQIQINKERKHLGVFSDIKEAKKTYDEALIKYFGIFAKTNKEILGEETHNEI